MKGLRKDQLPKRNLQRPRREAPRRSQLSVEMTHVRLVHGFCRLSVQAEVAHVPFLYRIEGIAGQVALERWGLVGGVTSVWQAC